MDEAGDMTVLSHRRALPVADRVENLSVAAAVVVRAKAPPLDDVCALIQLGNNDEICLGYRCDFLLIF